MYRVSLLIVAAGMLIIPLLYLAMIGGTAYGTWWYATHTTEYFFSARKTVGQSHLSPAGSGRAMLVIVGVGYVLPLMIGGSVLIALLKSLIAPRGGDQDRFTIERFEEPTLYQFVETICDQMGAPAPSRIDVTADVNASAGVDGGLLGLLTGRKLVLTIGLPLVSGLGVNQFAGILAHEFGHFSQSAGLGAYLMIDSIRNWIMRLVFQRDAWDRVLMESYVESRSGLITFMAGACMLVTFLVRVLFLVLLALATLLFMILSRQMEYDADRHEARFAGSQPSVATFGRVADLNAAARLVSLEIRDYLKREQLPDDLPALVAATAGTLSPEAREKFRKGRSRFRLMDSHPGDASRIARVQAAAEPGIFHADQPASVLFRDFAGACRKATYASYKSELGRAFYGATMVPVAALAKDQQRHAARLSKLADYLGYEPPDWRPLFPQATQLQGFDDPRKATAMIKAARAAIEQDSAQAQKAADAFRAADQEQITAASALFWIDSSLGPLPKDLDLKPRSRNDIGLFATRAKERSIAACAVIDPLSEHASARLVAALRLLHTKGAERHVEGAEKLRARSRHLYAAMIALRDIFPSLRAARSHIASAVLVAQANVKTHEKFLRIKGVLRPLVDDARGRLEDIRRDTGEVPYPFENPTGPISLAQRLVDASPSPGDIDATLNACARAVERYPSEVRRVLAELVEIAATIEKSFKRPSSEAPP